jgi:hypothetical protein
MRTPILEILLLSILASCKQTDKAGPSAPVVISSVALFEQFSDDSGVAVASRYPSGVTFSSTVQGVDLAANDKDSDIMMAVDSQGERMVSIGVKLIDAASLKAKPPTRGMSITVTCKDGKGYGSVLLLTQCTM